MAVVSPPSKFIPGVAPLGTPDPKGGGSFVSLISVICEIIQAGVAVSALLLEISLRVRKKKDKNDKEK